MADPLWTFWELETVGGRGVIKDWVEGLSDEVEIEFHGILRNLAVTPRQLWVRPVYDVFGPDFGEIRFKVGNLQHRVFGFFLAGTTQYVMLIGATKKGKNYNPRDAVNTAGKRHKLVTKNRSQLREYTAYKLDDV